MPNAMPSNMTVAESRQQRTDRASQAIGRLLLQAWTMLDETCPSPNCGCVIMQAPNRGRKACVLCGDLPLVASPAPPAPASAAATTTSRAVVDSAMMDDEDDEVEEDVQLQLALETERQRARLLAAAGGAPLTVPAATVTSTTVFEPSRLLGQRMLQGWTLLGDVCPVCTVVPLVEKDNVRECVACGPPAAPPSSAPGPSGTPVVQDPRPAAPAPPRAAPASSSPQFSRLATAAVPTMPPAAAAPGGGPRSTDHLHLHSIVERKIQHVAAKLDAADRVTDIQHCAQVLRELLALRKELV